MIPEAPSKGFLASLEDLWSGLWLTEGQLQVQSHELGGGHCLRWFESHGERRCAQWLIQVSAAQEEAKTGSQKFHFQEHKLLPAPAFQEPEGRDTGWARLFTATAPAWFIPSW